jgi:hypothetical protein
MANVKVRPTPGKHSGWVQIYRQKVEEIGQVLSISKMLIVDLVVFVGFLYAIYLLHPWKH